MKKGIVLGATGKLGIAITKKLKEEHYFVIGTFRDEIKKKTNPYCDKLIKLNIDNEQEIQNFLKEINSIDFFINTISNKPTINRFEKISDEIFQKDYEVNVLSQIKILKQIIPKFNKGSHLIFLLSEMILNNKLAYASSYTLTKFTLFGLMKILSYELKNKEIYVNSISPGLMETNFTSNIPSFIKENYKNKINDKKLLAPEEVAEKIIEILNEDKTGTNIPLIKN